MWKTPPPPATAPPTAQRWDNGLGLYDYNARYYDPHIGRFISADTLVPDPAAPQAFNRYAYVLGNPLRYSDPTGHLTEDEIRNYFGFEAGGGLTLLQVMLNAWKDQEFLVDWLLHHDTHFGDVITYTNHSGDFGEAMLVLFETGSAGSGVYAGGFFGVGRLRVGEEVYRSSIKSLNGSSWEAGNLERLYAENFGALRSATGANGSNYYDPVMYSDLRTPSHFWSAVSGLGALATAVYCYTSPAGLASCLTVGSLFGLLGVGSVFTANTVDYPLLRVPDRFGLYPSHIYGFGAPTGFYGNQ